MTDTSTYDGYEATPEDIPIEVGIGSRATHAMFTDTWEVTGLHFSDDGVDIESTETGRSLDGVHLTALTPIPVSGTTPLLPMRFVWPKSSFRYLSPDRDESDLLHPIEWNGFFQRERKDPTFTIPVLVPEGRQTAVFAVKKLGKSLLTLDVSAAAATGRSVLGEDPQDPISVIYLDMEMTEDDVWERLLAMGYGPADEANLAQWFNYYLLPVLPALDTAAGGEALMTLVELHNAAVVVIDTTSRVISGRENDSDTFHGMYRFTGLRLKQKGVGLLRLDHAGHAETDHARGSSAKGTDVDTVYQLTKRTDGKLLLAHHGVTRVPWLPDNVVIERQADPLRHVVVQGAPTAEAENLAKLLDGMGLASDTSIRACQEALKAAEGKGRRQDVVADAVRLRRARAGERKGEQAS